MGEYRGVVTAIPDIARHTLHINLSAGLEPVAAECLAKMSRLFDLQCNPQIVNGALSLPLNEFRAIDSSPDKANLTRAASKINENLYASTALERGTLKIKSIQMTWLPIQGPEQKAAKAKAQEYMAAVIRTLTPFKNSAYQAHFAQGITIIKC